MARSFALVAALLLVPLAAWAGDNDLSNGENRCDDLGSNCSCALSLDDTSYTDVGGGSQVLWSPDSQTSNECTFYTSSGGPTDPNSHIVAESALVSGGYGDRLPSGNSV